MMEAETKAETLLFLPKTRRCKVHNVSVMQSPMSSHNADANVHNVQLRARTV